MYPPRFVTASRHRNSRRMPHEQRARHCATLVGLAAVVMLHGCHSPVVDAPGPTTTDAIRRVLADVGGPTFSVNRPTSDKSIVGLQCRSAFVGAPVLLHDDEHLADSFGTYTLTYDDADKLQADFGAILNKHDLQSSAGATHNTRTKATVTITGMKIKSASDAPAPDLSSPVFSLGLKELRADGLVLDVVRSQVSTTTMSFDRTELSNLGLTLAIRPSTQFALETDFAQGGRLSVVASGEGLVIGRECCGLRVKHEESDTREGRTVDWGIYSLSLGAGDEHLNVRCTMVTDDTVDRLFQDVKLGQRLVIDRRNGIIVFATIVGRHATNDGYAYSWEFSRYSALWLDKQLPEQQAPVPE